VNPGKEAVAALAGLDEAEAAAAVARMSEAAVRRLACFWPAWVHEGQEVPEGDWRVWVMLGGRGFGKTRAGAEWVAAFARANGEARIALVAATPDEARRVMIEGKSGLLAVGPARERPLWEPSRGRLCFPGGAQAFVYSGSNPEGLRGPEHHIAWCDELAKWRRPEECWANLQLGLRCGQRPQALVTTTPRKLAALKEILADEGTVKGGGPSAANPHLPEGHLAAMERLYGGTRLGRQELGGELIDETQDALWPRDLIEASRCAAAPAAMKRIVVGVDPPAGTSGDACGIVVCGLGEDGVGYVLGDYSVAGLSPEGWARKVAAAAAAHGTRRVVAEANNGGEMVRSVLRAADDGLAVKLVHAADSKEARAGPVAILFERGRAKLVGACPALEDELAALSWSGSYQGPGRSPDRADALVWALSELMLKPAQAEPRLRRF
jgi:phage terminase large subunit-like protein